MPLYDFKTRLGISFMIALVIAILTFGLVNPIVVWYLGFVPNLISCGTAGVFCDVPVAILSYGVPLFALFLCVASIFEAFIK